MNPFFTKAALVEKISAVLGYSLDPAQVQITQAEPSTGFGTNREVQVHATYTSQQGEQETKTFYFFRLDLAELGSRVSFAEKVPVYESANVHHLLPYIRDYTGINFTVEDLEDVAPVIDPANTASFLIPLVAKPGSWWFKGSTNLKVGRKPHLQTILINADLGTI